MKQALLLFILSIFLIALSHNSDKIEIFDIEKRNLLKSIQKTTLIEKELIKNIDGINNVSNKINPIPNKGYIIKISFSKAVLINNNVINQYINDAYIILPKDGDPSLMIYDDENIPNFYILNTTKEDLLTLFRIK